jgi:hypothetical protein
MGRAVLFTAVVLFLVFFIYASIPYRSKYGYMKDVGEFISDTHGPGSTIMLQEYDTRMLLYADGRGEYYTSVEDAAKIIEADRPDYVVWDTRLGPKTEEFDALLERNGYGLLETWEGKEGNEVYLYTITANTENR